MKKIYGVICSSYLNINKRVIRTKVRFVKFDTVLLLFFFEPIKKMRPKDFRIHITYVTQAPSLYLHWDVCFPTGPFTKLQWNLTSPVGILRQDCTRTVCGTCNSEVSTYVPSFFSCKTKIKYLCIIAFLISKFKFKRECNAKDLSWFNFLIIFNRIIINKICLSLA